MGKGIGNRIFAHVNDALNNPTSSDKLDRIRAIREQGYNVQHIILRHGLTEKEAFEVEAAVIDLLGIDELTNLVAGHESGERGRMNARDIIAQYNAQPITIDEPTILIIVNRLFRYGMSAEELYEITRGNWVVGPRRNEAKYACTVYRGIVREVYRIHGWFPVDARNPEQVIQDPGSRTSAKSFQVDLLKYDLGCDPYSYLLD
ncbi:MAG: hypothetical protein JXJ17_19930 [Anaerolineae bacterium]|nr:hypothetical protein [Anaerolineae bacterium]